MRRRGALSLRRGASFAGCGSRFRGRVREPVSGCRTRMVAVLVRVVVCDCRDKANERKKENGKGEERKGNELLGICSTLAQKARATSSIGCRNLRRRLARELTGMYNCSYVYNMGEKHLKKALQDSRNSLRFYCLQCVFSHERSGFRSRYRIFLPGMQNSLGVPAGHRVNARRPEPLRQHRIEQSSPEN